jgi:hypothetical protein
MADTPLQRHPHCKIDRCQICLADCEALTDYLLDRTQLSRHRFDILGEYRLWLDQHEIPAESPSGWPLPAVFDAENIKAFIADMTSATSEKGPKQP